LHGSADTRRGSKYRSGCSKGSSSRCKGKVGRANSPASHHLNLLSWSRAQLRCNRAGEMGRGAAGGRDGNATTGASAKIVRDINVEVGISAGTRRTIVALESLVFISPVVFENALDMNPAGTAVAAGPSIAGFLVLLFVVHVHAVWAVLIFVVLESTSITKHHRSIQDVRKPSLSPLRSFYGSAILATLLKVVNQISSQHNIRGARSERWA